MINSFRDTKCPTPKYLWSWTVYPTPHPNWSTVQETAPSIRSHWVRPAKTQTLVHRLEGEAEKRVVEGPHPRRRIWKPLPRDTYQAPAIPPLGATEGDLTQLNSVPQDWTLAPTAEGWRTTHTHQWGMMTHRCELLKSKTHTHVQTPLWEKGGNTRTDVYLCAYFWKIKQN